MMLEITKTIGFLVKIAVFLVIQGEPKSQPLASCG
jgi:hypothetical protein